MILSQDGGGRPFQFPKPEILRFGHDGLLLVIKKFKRLILVRLQQALSIV